MTVRCQRSQPTGSVTPAAASQGSARNPALETAATIASGEMAAWVYSTVILPLSTSNARSVTPERGPSSARRAVTSSTQSIPWILKTALAMPLTG